MCKRRRLKLPKLPIFPDEFELLIDSPFSSNHRLTIRDGIDTAIMFATSYDSQSTRTTYQLVLNQLVLSQLVLMTIRTPINQKYWFDQLDPR